MFNYKERERYNMNCLTFHAPTAIYNGPNCIREKKNIIKSFGNRAFIITGKFSAGYPNTALEDVQKLFAEMDIIYSVCDEVEENPSVESIVKITELVRSFAPEYIFAIGGGSALDSAKAVNVLLNYLPSADPYKVFYDGKPSINTRSSGKLPMIAVPTTAGSGSDVMGYSILTRADTNTKLRINQLSFFSTSFLDARYVVDSPIWLLESGALDALAHGIEGVLNVFATPLSRLWNNYGFSLFSEFNNNLLRQELTEEDCGKMLLAASVQGMGNMQCCSTIPHGLGYSLTHFKGVPHGFSNMLVMASFLRSIKSRAAVNDVLNRSGFSDLDEFDDYMQNILERNVSIEVSHEELRAWAKECASLKSRIEAHIEPITEEDIYEILRESLKKYIK